MAKTSRSTEKGKVLRAPYCALLFLNTIMKAIVLVAKTRRSSAKTSQSSNPLLYARDVLGIIPDSGKSCAILLYPDLQRVDNLREDVRNAIVRTHLISSYPEQLI